jgi:hypothetical protein
LSGKLGSGDDKKPVESNRIGSISAPDEVNMAMIFMYAIIQ